MCVIIVQPTGTHIEKDMMKRAWDKNPDGGGFAYITDAGSIKVEKYMEWNEFWPAFENARSLNPGRDFLLHTRIATHGSVCLDNVHPYQVNEHTVMAHNGIIHGVPDYKDDDRSDTKVFIDEVLPTLPSNWLDRPYLVKMVEKWIGWSKLTFLTTDVRLEKSLYILNADEGTVEDGMWMSNTTPLLPVARPIVKYSTTPGVYMGQDWTRPSDSLRVPTERDRATVAQLPLNLAELENRMLEQRIEVNLFQEFAWDALEGNYVCVGCDTALDPVTNECKCFERICLDCHRFAGECDCTGGVSLNLADFDNVEEVVADEALDHSYVYNM